MLDAERLHLRETCAFSERALLIILGGTVTVLAGFLSQVWGSADIAFRTELARYLRNFGWLFTTSFALPPLRLFSLRPMLSASWLSVPIFFAWAVATLVITIVYISTLGHLGETIMHFAVKPPAA